MAIAIVWTAVELINGIGHPLWSLSQGGYTPGVATAPLLFIVGLLMAGEIRVERRRDGGRQPE